jgi:tRNA synthetase class I (E and Q)
MGEGDRTLSKRDTQSNLFSYGDRGFIPEGLLNYLALLGWSIADDRDACAVDELVEVFDIRHCQGERQPCPFRSEEGRSRQRHPRAGAGGGRRRRAGGALSGQCRRSAQAAE